MIEQTGRDPRDNPGSPAEWFEAVTKCMPPTCGRPVMRDGYGDDHGRQKEDSRFQDPAELICPECAEQAVPEPPISWAPGWGPRSEFSHCDGEPLCPVLGAGGYVPVYPVVK